jgi:hypothetical protein
MELRGESKFVGLDCNWRVTYRRKREALNFPSWLLTVERKDCYQIFVDALNRQPHMSTKGGFVLGVVIFGHHSSQVFFFGTEKKSGVYDLPASGTPQFRARRLESKLCALALEALR